MSDKSEEMAIRFSGMNADLIALLEGCSPEAWQAVCAGEQWPVCAVARHVAVSERVIAGWIRSVAKGTAVAVTRDMIDARNLKDAEANTRCDQQETIALLRRQGKIAADTIRALGDEQLAARAAMGPAHGRELSARQVIERVLISHVEEHTASIRASVAAGTRQD